MFFSSLVGLLLVNTLSINANSEITVHSGDTLSGLAQKYHVSVTAIERTNHLHGAVTLVSGKKLVLPNQTDPDAAPQSSSSDVSQNTDDNGTQSDLSPKEQAAKNWVAYHESRGQYHVNNGKYYGKFELDSSLLKGDYSKANQERTANCYVHRRYGSWVHAKHFWETHNWY